MLRERCISPADLYRSLAILRGQPVPEPTPPPSPASTQNPASSIQNQGTSIQNPVSSTQDPASGIPNPTVSNQAPAASNQNPGTSIPDSPDWDAFHDEIRLRERNMAIELFDAANERIFAIRSGTAARHSLSDVSRLLDIASRLARRALGKTDELEVGNSTSEIFSQFEQAVNQICAQPPVPPPAESKTEAAPAADSSPTAK